MVVGPGARGSEWLISWLKRVGLLRIEGVVLSFVVAVDLSAVLELDALDELMEQIDELHGGLVGEVRQAEPYDYGGGSRFH
jgi:hypothetical protein